MLTPPDAQTTRLATQIGARIRVLRMERGFSVRKLAEVAGCSISTICNVESGVSGGTTRVLQRIAIALRVELVDLFNVDAQTDNVGYILERLRIDPGALQLASELLARRPSSGRTSQLGQTRK